MGLSLSLLSICLGFNGDSYPNKGDTSALNEPSVLNNTIYKIQTNTNTGSEDNYPNKGDSGALNGPSVLDSTAILLCARVLAVILSTFLFLALI